MPAPDTLLHPPRERAGARTGGAAMPAPAAAHRHRMACRACGQPWFGAVAYCPYCGRPSVPPRSAAPSLAQKPRVDGPQLSATRSAPAIADPAPPQPATTTASAAREPRVRRLVGLVATLAAAIVMVLLALGLQDRLDRSTRARAPAPSPAAVAAPAAQAVPAPSQDVQPPVPPHVDTVAAPAPVTAPTPAPPPRNRSLCSAANQAAGLCNPN